MSDDPRTAEASDADAALVRAIIGQRLGGEPRAIERRTAGLSNRVFTVEHESGPLVVRLSDEPGRLDRYRKERWAAERVRAEGVPVPEVLAVAETPQPCAWMIARRAEGREATDHPDRLRVLHALGGWAARIHGIRANGFGGGFEPGVGLACHASWSAFLAAELGLEGRLATLARQRMLSPERLRRLVAVLDEAGAAARPTLNHGDLRLKNVLVDDAGAITAIIDWEHCTASVAPAWDLSLALHDLSIDAKHAFLEGYGLDEAAVMAQAPLIKALNVLNYVPEIERAAHAGDEAQLRRLRMRLSGALDLYSF